MKHEYEETANPKAEIILIFFKKKTLIAV